MPRKARILLTADDWQEIYYALETKRIGIKEGKFGPEDEPGHNKKWIAQLESIEAKIGPDGEEAAKRGVLRAT
jgi:hypothetical protein